MPVLLGGPGPYASVADVATTLVRSIPANDSPEFAAWTMWIADAERQIRGRLGDLALLDAEDLAFVVRESVALKVKSPDPVTQVSMAVDDASVSRHYARATGQVTILDEWWDLLTPNSQDSSAFTINPLGL